MNTKLSIILSTGLLAFISSVTYTEIKPRLAKIDNQEVLEFASTIGTCSATSLNYKPSSSGVTIIIVKSYLVTNGKEKQIGQSQISAKNQMLGFKYDSAGLGMNTFYRLRLFNAQTGLPLNFSDVVNFYHQLSNERCGNNTKFEKYDSNLPYTYKDLNMNKSAI